MKPKLLYWGDGKCGTGFGRVFHSLLPHLRPHYDIVCCLINWHGEPTGFDGLFEGLVTVPSSCADVGDDVKAMSPETFGKLIEEHKPDLVWCQMDAFNLSPALSVVPATTPLVGDCVIDGENQYWAAETLNERPMTIITQTEFGKRELQKSGMKHSIHVVPYGVNHQQFKPMDRLTCRRAINLPPHLDNAFIIGRWSRNTTRKGLTEQMFWFKEWLEHEGIDDAYLLFHHNILDHYGVNTMQMAVHIGIDHRIIFSRRPGTNPSELVREDELPQLMNACDLHWSTSIAEGWDLPALESMACGIPQLLPEHSAYAEWAVDGARLYAAEEPCVERQVGVIHRLPDRFDALCGLNDIYYDKKYRDDLSIRATRHAAKYSWRESAAQYRQVFDGLITVAV